MTAYPSGMRLVRDRATKELDDGSLLGGSPQRLLRLSAAGRRAYDELRDAPVTTVVQASLARRLTYSGVLHPQPEPGTAVDATVLIPVRDRPDALDACLRVLGSEHPVVVVDDGSTQPDAIAKVCAEHGVRCIVRNQNGGPAAARNTGLAEIETEFVLLLDSDCLPPAGLIADLAGHFADPLVAAVAPRVQGDTGYLSPLDLGGSPASVAPGRRVAYVATATLLVRRSAMPVFDEDLRYGEDVDVVWRLVAAGNVVRYDPHVAVIHAEPRSWSARLRRRYHYGTSAGPLAQRHPGMLPPLVVHSWSTLTVAGVLLRRPGLAALGVAGAYRELGEIPSAMTRAELVARSAWSSWLGWSRCSAQFALPLVALAARRRPRLLALLLTAPFTRWWAHGGRIDPARFALAELAGDAAYGAGVIAGSLRAHTLGPLRPVSTRHRRNR